MIEVALLTVKACRRRGAERHGGGAGEVGAGDGDRGAARGRARRGADPGHGGRGRRTGAVMSTRHSHPRSRPGSAWRSAGRRRRRSCRRRRRQRRGDRVGEARRRPGRGGVGHRGVAEVELAGAARREPREGDRRDDALEMPAPGVDSPHGAGPAAAELLAGQSRVGGGHAAREGHDDGGSARQSSPCRSRSRGRGRCSRCRGPRPGTRFPPPRRRPTTPITLESRL